MAPNQQDASRCPINLFPGEVLSEIMVVSLYDARGSRLVLLESKNAPLVLCRVCSLWRAIAFSTSTLWKEFKFEVMPNSLPWKISPLHLFLRHSNAQLLTIVVDACAFDDSHQSVDAIRPFADAFSQHSHRWYSMRIIGPRKITGMMLSRAGLVPNLDVLVLFPQFITIGQPVQPRVSERPRIDLSKYPRLRSLFVGTHHFEISFGGSSKNNLATLNIIGCLRFAMEIISHSPILFHLHIGAILEDDPALPVPCGRVQLPRLAQLQVSLHADTPLFDHIDAPALEEFQYIEEGPTLLPRVSEMLSRTKPPLRRFLYMGEYYRDQLRDFIALFANAPTLTELVFYLPPIHESVFDVLAYLGPGRVLPRLENITVYEVQGEKICAWVHAFVASRVFQPDSRLKWLTLPKAVVDGLKELSGTARVLETQFRYKVTGPPNLDSVLKWY